MRRVPALETAGIQMFFYGPESFTPDVRYHLGESPELAALFVAAGLNSIGLQSAGGVGKVLAEWILDGHPPMDLWEVDVRRNMPFQINRSYLRDRDGRERSACSTPRIGHSASTRPRAACANRRCMIAGGSRRVLRRGLRLGAAQLVRARGRRAAVRVQLWPPELVRASARASISAVRGRGRSLRPIFVRQIRLEGRRCRSACSIASAPNDVDVPPGKIVYTQWLNERGGIEADLTVTREAEDGFLIVTSGAETETRISTGCAAHRPGAHCVVDQCDLRHMRCCR